MGKDKVGDEHDSVLHQITVSAQKRLSAADWHSTCKKQLHWQLQVAAEIFGLRWQQTDREVRRIFIRSMSAATKHGDFARMFTTVTNHEKV